MTALTQARIRAARSGHRASPNSPSWARRSAAELEASIGYADLFRSLPDIVLYESGGGRQHFTSNLPRMLGLTHEEYVAYIGRFDALIHPDDLPGCEAARAEWEAAGATGVLSLELRLRHSSGEYIWIRDRMVLISPPGERPYHAGVMVDITVRKAAEEQSRAAEAATREAQLQTAELRAIRATTATYAHEINTPLAGILANAQMLREALADGQAGSNAPLAALNEQQLEMLDETAAAAQQISRVLDQMQRLCEPSYREDLGRGLLDLKDE
jgi:PAS domain S-box-containing protein